MRTGHIRYRNRVNIATKAKRFAVFDLRNPALASSYSKAKDAAYEERRVECKTAADDIRGCTPENGTQAKTNE
jgi:hypothetical protein